MKALVVYESMFGNTERIARAVAEGLQPAFDVTIADASTTPSPAGMDLVVIGGPTHAFGMSRPTTRADAGRQGRIRPGAADAGIREWLDRSPAIAGMAAAAFDTRVDKPRVPGSAAHKAYRRLRRLGGRMVVRPESFWVTGTPGPLLSGEERRAQRWAAALAAAAAPAASHRV